MFNNITFFADATAPAAQQVTATAVQTAPEGAPIQEQSAMGNGVMTIAIYVLMFVGLYVLLFLPARKQRKALQKLQSELKAGDNVVTTSGIIGKIVSINETEAVLQVSAGTQITFLRTHIVGKSA